MFFAVSAAAIACSPLPGEPAAIAPCAGSCDEIAESSPMALDIVGAEDRGGELDGIVLAWQPLGEEDGAFEQWLGRKTSSGEYEWIEQLAANQDTAHPVLDRVVETFVVRAVNGAGDTIAQSNEVVAHGIEYGHYRVALDDATNDSGAELSGHVWSPRQPAVGSRPLVIMVHGNHSICLVGSVETCDRPLACEQKGGTLIDSALGYDYLGKSLASKGYVAVSIDANEYNCTAEQLYQRAELLLAHLDRWSQWKAVPPEDEVLARAAAAVDSSLVGFFGHSRGAEAAVAATELLAAPDSRFPAQTTVSVVSLASSESHEHQAVGASLLTLLPACDGDANTQPGRHAWDRSAGGERSADLHQALIAGANHNFFNRAWPVNDSTCPASTQLTRDEQESALSVLVGAFFDASLRGVAMPAASRGAREAFPRLDAAVGRSMDLRWSFAGAGSLIIESATAERVAETNNLGGANLYENLEAEVLYWPGRRVLSLFWPSVNSEPLIRHELAGVDATSFSAISFRAAAQLVDLEDGERDLDAVIRVADVLGNEAELSLLQWSGFRAQSAGHPLNHLRTIRIPAAAVHQANPALDWSALSHFEIDLGGVPSSVLSYGDVELTH